MSDSYLGEIRTVGFNFAPVGWLQCNGQFLSISEYNALYALLGTTYGGDGQSTFAVPNLQSRVNVAAGNGPGLSAYTPGQIGGTEAVTLNNTQLPTHAHPFTVTVNASTNGAATNNAAGNYPGNANTSLYNTTPSSAMLAAGSLTSSAQPAGGSQAHTNIQPVLALNCIICVEGIFPPQQ